MPRVPLVERRLIYFFLNVAALLAIVGGAFWILERL